MDSTASCIVNLREEIAGLIHNPSVLDRLCPHIIPPGRIMCFYLNGYLFAFIIMHLLIFVAQHLGLPRGLGELAKKAIYFHRARGY